MRVPELAEYLRLYRATIYRMLRSNAIPGFKSRWRLARSEGLGLSAMNLCHAAALALVGWYLLIPPASEMPIICDDRTGILDSFRCSREAHWHTLGQAMYMMSFGDEEPVFSGQWITMWSFDTLTNCETRLGKAIHAFDDMRAKSLESISLILVQRAMRFAAANCVATDDPRVAK